ncbi:trimeric LpxA-like protein [Eremomyces bilateralis CBS 781.70]|uniref:Dynactin subunit 6 n=1 Tax=Eremomyces bilateralis CBS 781.70 TaxID=1392243 RepID=A0A6G1FSG5_9PEZI|nr:trimeric LpxA-like protein [Eremomyces bilateralis CBS 781.70]KAF1808724.1 trimeric LpxA-like protein [Eremomyces bilateralis CBS 781.70]
MSETKRVSISAPQGTPSEGRRTSTTAASRQSLAAKRQSLNFPKAPTVIDPSAIVSTHAILTGLHPITIGPDVVLHPYCKISSVEGPVTIGRGCIVAERAVVGFTTETAAQGDSALKERDVTLNRNVVVGTSAVVEAKVVDEGCLVGAGCHLKGGSNVGKYCKIAPMVIVQPDEWIYDFMVVYGQNARRRDMTMITNKDTVFALKKEEHEQHLAVLKRLIPSNLTKWQ